MKVLWFANSPCGSVRRFSRQTVGGGWLLSLEDELKKQKGIDLHIAYLSVEKEASYEFEGVIYHPVVIERGKSFFSKLRHDRRSLSSVDEEILPKILFIINDVTPDIIHIHGTEFSWGLCVHYVKKIPIVFSIQGLIGPITNKYLTGLTLKDIKPFDSIMDHILHQDIKNSYRSFIYRSEREMEYLKKANYIFGRTRWDEMCTLSFNPARKYYMVGEIMRTPFYMKEWKGIERCNGHVIIISTISGAGFKGIETIMEAAYLLQRNTCFNFEWQIIGYTEDNKYVRAAERKLKLISSEQKIKYLGRLDANMVSERLQKADNYVNASHIENSSNSLSEALLMGVPCIATFAGGTASLIEDGKDGILVQEGEPYVMAGAIVYLIQHPNIMKLFSVEGRKNAMKRHAPQKIVMDLLIGYNSIIEDFQNNKSLLNNESNN